MIVDQYVFRNILPQITFYRSGVVADSIVVCLSRLGHDIADQNLHASGRTNRLADAVYQQIRDDAALKASRPQHDHVRV